MPGIIHPGMIDNIPAVLEQIMGVLWITDQLEFLIQALGA
jgi:hypothetical protein